MGTKQAHSPPAQWPRAAEGTALGVQPTPSLHAHRQGLEPPACSRPRPLGMLATSELRRLAPHRLLLLGL